MGKKGRRLPEVLTPQEQGAILDQPGQDRLLGFRNYCMVRIMLNLGLRASEILNLKVNSVDWHSGKVLVNGKGNKDRTLKLNREDLDLLRRWWDRRPAQESEYLFTTFKGKRILDRYLRQMVKRLAAKAGLLKDIHPHSLRHSFATDFLRQTKNLRLTQKALGHARISTTEIYTHITDEELEEALETFRAPKIDPVASGGQRNQKGEGS